MIKESNKLKRLLVWIRKVGVLPTFNKVTNGYPVTNSIGKLFSGATAELEGTCARADGNQRRSRAGGDGDGRGG